MKMDKKILLPNHDWTHLEMCAAAGWAYVPLSGAPHHLRYRCSWNVDEPITMHAMVAVPVQSVIYMLGRIEDLQRERDHLFNLLENARMG